MPMTKVNLPPGCRGFDMKDGTRYTAKREGGSVTVDDRHAQALNTGQFAGDGNLITASGAVTIGTRKSRRCEPCGRIWNAWSTECPKCGAATDEWHG